MKRATIRIVAEGKIDQLVIKELVGAYLAERPDMGFNVEFIEEQPTSDRTSGGGWGLVYKWCLSNPPQEREATYFGTGLFANDMGELACDGLLIHMDSDICEEIGNKTSISPSPSSDAPASVRGLFIKQVIEEWLWPDQTARSDRHIIAPAVEATEAWLVAGLSDDDVAPESNRDIQKRLAELDHIVVRNVAIPDGLRYPNKTIRNYTKILAVARQNSGRIFDRCPHFKAMVNEIALIANAA